LKDNFLLNTTIRTRWKSNRFPGYCWINTTNQYI